MTIYQLKRTIKNLTKFLDNNKCNEEYIDILKKFIDEYESLTNQIHKYRIKTGMLSKKVDRLNDGVYQALYYMRNRGKIRRNRLDSKLERTNRLCDRLKDVLNRLKPFRRMIRGKKLYRQNGSMPLFLTENERLRLKKALIYRHERLSPMRIYGRRHLLYLTSAQKNTFRLLLRAVRNKSFVRRYCGQQVIRLNAKRKKKLQNLLDRWHGCDNCGRR